MCILERISKNFSKEEVEILDNVNNFFCEILLTCGFDYKYNSVKKLKDEWARLFNEFALHEYSNKSICAFVVRRGNRYMFQFKRDGKIIV